jgi:hypothetical protein
MVNVLLGNTAQWINLGLTSPIKIRLVRQIGDTIECYDFQDTEDWAATEGASAIDPANALSDEIAVNPVSDIFYLPIPDKAHQDNILIGIVCGGVTLGYARKDAGERSTYNPSLLPMGGNRIKVVEIK